MNLAQKFEIHYYLSDKSHSINALARNKCEAEFLAAVTEVASILDVKIIWEAQALEEGGVVEIWKALGENSAQIALVISAFAFVWSVIPKEDQELIDLQKEDLRLSIEARKVQINKIKKEAESPENIESAAKEVAAIIKPSVKIATRRSNFYKTLATCTKVDRIGLSKLSENNKKIGSEFFVQKTSFPNFVLSSLELQPIYVSNAIIEIVSPVFKPGDAKWRGIYEGRIVSFALEDASFKSKVLSSKVSFASGSTIICDLLVKSSVNEFGESVRPNYSVEKVHEILDSNAKKIALMRDFESNPSIKQKNQKDLFLQEDI